MLEGGIFFDLTIIFLVVTMLAFIAKLLKQPLIPVYIISGIILVPVLNLIQDQTFVSSLSQFGIVFLLFIAGLELDFDRLRHVSFVASIGGTILVLVLFLIGFAIANIFSVTSISAVYLGLLFSFSSTMVVVKVLSDRKELDSLHGKIALGFLVIQDVFAIFAFIVLTSYGQSSLFEFFLIILKVFVILISMYLFSKYLLPSIFSFAAKSQELLFVVSIAVCLAFALIFGLVSPHALGIGAFLAGLALANLPYNVEIISRVGPLKDFFSLLFFIALGMSLPLDSVMSSFYLSITFIFLIIFLRPLITFIVVRFFNYMPRVSFLTALTQSQVSEFALILAFFGLSANHISEDLFSSIIVIAIVSLSLTSYLFQHQSGIYNTLKKYLGWILKSNNNYDLEYLPDKINKKFILLLGYDRLGYGILQTLQKRNEIVIVVDFNPEIIKKLMEEGIHCVYGDISDLELLNNLNLKQCKLVISTIPEKTSNLLVLQQIKEINKKALCYLTSETINEAYELYEEGADYVIIPRMIGGKHISNMIETNGFNYKKILQNKIEHLNELSERKKHASRHD